jgi:DNA-binding response OmpR family regulator
MAAAYVPVLILTGYGDDTDIVEGFESGCNDYLAKPYSFPVLLMRSKELLSRGMQAVETVTVGQLSFDKTSGRVFCNGTDLSLKPKEFALLLFLAQNKGKVINAEYIYEKVWRSSMADDKRSLQTRVSAVRKKLEEVNSGYTINSVYGKGYCFEMV